MTIVLHSMHAIVGDYAHCNNNIAQLGEIERARAIGVRGVVKLLKIVCIRKHCFEKSKPRHCIRD